MTGPERDLWRRWKQRRDARAFEALVERFGAFAYDFARRAAGHDADAEDLAQDAFLEMAEASNADKVGFRAFLGRRISLGAKMLRRAALTRARLDKNAHVPTHPENAVENREATEAALELLDDEEREVVVLRFLHGLSYEEIAHVLGCKEGAARVRVHRALKQLRSRLGDKPELCIAALALFAPRSPLVAPTAQAAVTLTGGVLLMSAATKKVASLIVLLLFASAGVVTWRVSRDAPAVTQRAERPVREAAVEPQPEPIAEEPTTANEPEAARSIPKGKGSVAGVIRFADGEPFAKKKLSLWGSPAVMGETDAEGRFHIRGDWVYDRVLGVRRDDESYFFGLTTARMKPDQVIRLDLTLKRGFSLEGAITQNEKPVKDVEVHLRRRNDGEEQGGFGFVNANGRFRFDHVPAGVYHLYAKRPGLETVITTFELTRDTRLPIEMRPARELVVKFNNLPPAWIGARINLIVQQSTNPQFSFDFKPKIDERGEVRIDAPPPGVYRLQLIPGRSSPLPRLEANNVSIREGEPPLVAFDLPNGAGVVGSIVRANGQPYAEAQLAFEEGDYETRAGKDGSFSFGFVASGTNRLLLRGAGWQIVLAEIDIPHGGAIRNDVQLRGTARVFGKLVSDDSPQSRLVELFRAGEKEHARVWPAADGSFSMPHLEAGEYRLVAHAKNSMRFERSIVVAQGEEKDVGTLQPAAFPRIPVTVSVPAGREIPGLMTPMAKSDGRYHLAILRLNEVGHGHLTGLAPGRYEIYLAPNGCKPLRLSVKVGPDGGEPLTLRFEKAPIKLTVPIELLVPSGFELPDVIQVIAAGIDGTAPGNGFITVSNRILSNLPAGRYGLNFRIEGLEPKVVDVEIREGMDPIRVELVRESR